MRILVVEDDHEAAEYLQRALREARYEVVHASTTREGLFHAATEPFSAVVLDRNLNGGLDGLTVVRTLRGTGNGTPVLVLSGRSQTDDRIEGLRAGADDYLTKPYALGELLARLEALIRRSATPPVEATRLQLDGLEMDLLSRRVSRDGRAVALQPREFAILEYLLRHAGQLVTRSMLLEAVWGFRFSAQTNVIDVHISHLRAKIDAGFERPLLHTVRGSGYCLRADD